MEKQLTDTQIDKQLCGMDIFHFIMKFIDDSEKYVNSNSIKEFKEDKFSVKEIFLTPGYFKKLIDTIFKNDPKMKYFMVKTNIKGHNKIKDIFDNNLVNLNKEVRIFLKKQNISSYPDIVIYSINDDWNKNFSINKNKEYILAKLSNFDFSYNITINVCGVLRENELDFYIEHVKTFSDFNQLMNIISSLAPIKYKGNNNFTDITVVDTVKFSNLISDNNYTISPLQKFFQSFVDVEKEVDEVEKDISSFEKAIKDYVDREGVEAKKVIPSLEGGVISKIKPESKEKSKLENLLEQKYIETGLLYDKLKQMELHNEVINYSNFYPILIEYISIVLKNNKVDELINYFMKKCIDRNLPIDDFLIKLREKLI